MNDSDDFASLSAAAMSLNHVLQPLNDKISKYIGGRPIRIVGPRLLF
jgi:hypothetical protein